MEFFRVNVTENPSVQERKNLSKLQPPEDFLHFNRLKMVSAPNELSDGNFRSGEAEAAFTHRDTEASLIRLSRTNPSLFSASRLNCSSVLTAEEERVRHMLLIQEILIIINVKESK